MPDPAIVARVRALMARAADPGATEEEQRTSAHIAAKLCREHGIDIGAASASPPRERVIDFGDVRAAASAVNKGLGFDFFEFVQGLAQGIVQERMRRVADTLRDPPRAAPKKRKPPKKRAR